MSNHWCTRNNFTNAQGVEVSAAQIDILGAVGGFMVDADTIVRQLNALTDIEQIDVTISSPGGNVDDGITIYNALMAHPAKVVTTALGGASSAASVVFLAGDVRRMHTTSYLMIHEASAGRYGSKADADTLSQALGVMNEILRDAYVARTEIDADEAERLMALTTFMTPTDAVNRGFATEIIPAGETTEPAAAMNAVNFLPMINQLVASATAVPNRGITPQEDTMPDTTTAQSVDDAVTAERARFTAILSAAGDNTALATAMIDTGVSAEAAQKIAAAANAAPAAPAAEVTETADPAAATTPAGTIDVEPLPDDIAAQAAAVAKAAADQAFVTAMNAQKQATLDATSGDSAPTENRLLADLRAVNMHTPQGAK